MKYPRFEIFQSKRNKQWYFRLAARNGRTIAQSEGYKTKFGAQKGVEAVRRATLGSVDIFHHDV